MNDVDLDILSKNGVENIFIHSNAVDRFGEENVTKWVKKQMIKISKFILGASVSITVRG